MQLSQHYNSASLRTGLQAGLMAYVFVAFFLAGTSSALAQQSEQGAAESVSRLEEVIVTAQKREESLQKVPLALTVFSGDDLNASGIVDFKAISERTPGFSMGAFNQAQPQLYIRGIGSNEDGAAGDQSVIVYIDEVYIGRSAGMDIDLFDLERVEVLRGPQGTLFGRNVIGGAVNLITKKPTEETEMKFEATIGNFDRFDVRALVSGQVAENLYGKVSFSSRNRDGYLKSQIKKFPEFFPNISTGLFSTVRSLDVNTDSVRGSLRFVPSEKLEINLTGALSTLDQSGPTRVQRGQDNPFFQAAEELIPGITGDFKKALFEDPGLSQNDTSSVTLRVDYTFGDGNVFTSISSFREVDALVKDISGTPNLSALRLSTEVLSRVNEFSNDFNDNSDTLTQEFRLTSPSGGKFEWVTGAFYLHEDVGRNETVSFSLKDDDGMGGVKTILPPGLSGDDQHALTNSVAVFGQASYEILDGLKFTVGARYSYDDKQIRRIGTADGIVVPVDFSVKASKSWDKFTPKATIEYQATDNIFVYSTVSKGYKSGGFPGRSRTATIAGTPFGPETAVMLESGFRTQWLDGRIQFNPTGFYIDYTDLQILQLLIKEGEPQDGPGQLITQNAADAEIWGIETEYAFIPLDGLTIKGSFTYLDTKFTNFFAPVGFVPPAGTGIPQDRAGNRLRNAPKYASNLLVRYEWPAMSGGSMSVQGEWVHKGKVFQDPDNLEVAALPKYDKFDFRVGYRFPNRNLELTAWVENAFDEDYLLHNFPSQRGGFATPAPPRTYGMTLGWTFHK